MNPGQFTRFNGTTPGPSHMPGMGVDTWGGYHNGDGGLLVCKSGSTMELGGNFQCDGGYVAGASTKTPSICDAGHGSDKRVGAGAFLPAVITSGGGSDASSDGNAAQYRVVSKFVNIIAYGVDYAWYDALGSTYLKQLRKRPYLVMIWFAVAVCCGVHDIYSIQYHI